ncbi:M56 family metallopeptidase [Haoranjiania flava]|uniref:M48 family metalloprotease n=1 Tax=Haoranjiania flava TaxID=1856322 RepID=A0AAE3LKC8_9BACT|nr:M56 family metallopeptidase [Haoranjiania flava]MCU7694274.1 M48 family metalloprotease [Haoranjiania flava]
MNLLNAIGYSIIHILWQTAGIYVIFACVTKASPHNSKRIYGLALASQALIFLLFVSNIIYFSARQSVPAPTSATFSIQGLLPWITLGYLLFLLPAIVNYKNRANNIIKGSCCQHIDKQIVDFITTKAAELNIQKKIKLVITEFADAPFVTGFLKPAIFLPVSLLTQLTPIQVEAILLHEIIHIRRNDYLVNLLQVTVEKILYFNPLVKSIGNEARRQREMLCDKEVAFQYDRMIYSEALLSIARQNNLSALPVFANGNSQFELLERIKRLYGIPFCHSIMNYKVLLATVAFSLLGLLPQNPGRKAQTADQYQTAYRSEIKSFVNEPVAEVDAKYQSNNVSSEITAIKPIAKQNTQAKPAVTKIEKTATPVAEKANNPGKKQSPEVYTVTLKNNSPELLRAFKDLNTVLQNEQLQYSAYQAADIQTENGSVFSAENHIRTENYVVTIVENQTETTISIEKSGKISTVENIN